MTPVSQKNKINAERIIKNLEKRSMQGFYCETKEEALEKALEIIGSGSSVTWGGSESIKQIGLIDALKNGEYTVYDRYEAKTPEAVREIYLKAFDVDFFLMSTNAITMDGELLNIDGMGNRTAAMIYGPRNVLMIVGMNKVTSDLETAMKRVRMDACVPNTIRLEKNTPCRTTGKCHE